MPWLADNFVGRAKKQKSTQSSERPTRGVDAEWFGWAYQPKSVVRPTQICGTAPICIGVAGTEEDAMT